MTTSSSDGSANAPAGGAQLPNLLSSYSTRPPWEVAGVDYAVGEPAGTTLKDPATINIAGVTVHEGGAGGNYLLVSGNNVVLNGYNFSLEGGWQVDVTGNNATIENSYFLTQTTAQTPVYFEASAVGGTIEDNTFNGNNGATSSLTFGLPPLEIIGGGGTFVVAYNYIHDVYSDAINIGGSASTETFDIQYNVLENVGMGTDKDGHPDFIQTQTNASGGGTVFNNTEISYNTMVQTVAPPQGGTQGITLFDHTGVNPTFNGGDVSYNTLIAEPTTVTSTTEGVNPWISFEAAEVNGVATVTNNYVDTSGMLGVNGVTGNFLVTNDGVGSLSGSVVTSNNVMMKKGQASTSSTALSVSGVSTSPSSGTEAAGAAIVFTVKFSGSVVVTGAPSLSLNDGGTASYVSGSGTSSLTFRYTVGSSDTAVSALAITGVNLPSGAKIAGSSGTSTNLSNALITFPGLGVGTSTGTGAPTITAVSESPSSGALGAGQTVTLTLTASEAVTVANGTPTLTLNDGGVATYVSGSGTNTLTFTTTVAAGQNAASLAATAVNLNGGTIKDGSGNAASLTLTGLTQSGPRIDASAPTIVSISESPMSGDLGAGQTVTLKLMTSEAVTVANGTPTLTLNDGGVATYVSGSGTTSLTFTTTVAAGQNSSSLAATSVNLNGATIKDGAGNAASLTLSGLTQTGPKIGATTSKFVSISESPVRGDLGAGQTVTLTLAANEALTVVNGTPTLTLNDGGFATYVSGSGTTSLTFTTMVAAGENAASLAATAVNLNGATIRDGSGNVASLSLAGLTQSGPQMDTTAPKAPTILTDSIHRRSATLTGTAEPLSTIKVYDNGSRLVGSVQTNSSGDWTLKTGRLPTGANVFTATATDAAHNRSALSAPLDPIVGSTKTASDSALGGELNSQMTLGYQQTDSSSSTSDGAYATPLGLLAQYAAGFHAADDARGAFFTHHEGSDTAWSGLWSLTRPTTRSAASR